MSDEKNNNYEEYLNMEIANFISSFENAKSIFKNDNKNKLIHPGEYGTFKERIFKKFCNFSLPRSIDVASGFVVNSDKNITTQCDIILYKGDKVPFSLGMDDVFLQNEIVFSIGEMKSNITTDKLTEALIKLAMNKKIRNIPSDESLTIYGENVKYNKLNPYHNIFTFLFCNKIVDFKNIEILEEYINKEYDKKNIEYMYRHNLIISLEDGVIAYKSNGVINSMLSLEGNLQIPFPLIGENNFKYDIFSGKSNDFNMKKIEIIKRFIIHINNSYRNCTLWYPEPGKYIE